MKANDIKLIVILVVGVICSGLVAKKMVSMQETMNRSVHLSYASKMPIAGFQKFMADIVWMRFLNYAGTNQLTDKNVDTYNYYIRRIIALDPDFFEVYEWGVHFLSQEDLEKALEIVDMAMSHPRFQNDYKLPLLAGQLLMRPQWTNHYNGKPIQPDVARRAKKYYYAAKSASNATKSCLNAFIRVSALLQDNDDPKNIKELREWLAFYKTNVPEEGGELMEMDMSGEGFLAEDTEKRLLTQIHYISEQHIVNPNAKPEEKAKAKKIIEETISEYFPSRPFDKETYKPYNVSALKRYTGTISKPADGKKYVVELEAPEAYAVAFIKARAASGSAKVTVLIDGKPVEGLENVAVSTEKINHPGFDEVRSEPTTEGEAATVTKVRKSLMKNKGGRGSEIQLQFSDCKGCEELTYILSVYAGEY